MTAESKRGYAKMLAYLHWLASVPSEVFCKTTLYRYLRKCGLLGARRRDQPRAGESLTKIHSKDYIYEFISKHPSYPTEAAARQYYWSTGRQSAEHLREIISEFYPNLSISILEFASGYGCVTRHFSDILPETTVTACDIHPAAVKFLTKKLGVLSILSNAVPEQLAFDRTFDLVFALSFFSHIPKSTWFRWLKALISKVRPGGLIVFTTHGLESWKMMGSPQLDDEGFWFKPESEQLDLETTEYGTTITTPDFVRNRLSTISDASLLSSKEGFWWGHQDVYIVQRSNLSEPRLR
jgi:SAM-dependent methyltransferase